MIIDENHGLPDIAVDIAERFAERLSSRIDVYKAIDLLADLSQEQYESMVPEIQGLKNWVSAYKDQIDGLQHEIATTNFRFSQVLAEIVESRDQAKEYKARIDDLQHELATAESRFAQVCKTPPLDNVLASTLVAELHFRVRRRLDRMLRAPTA
jgi:septal ring factor EnvC (AmiA/AmiB activator)